jgi:predicted amidohydrolase YtcJ
LMRAGVQWCMSSDGALGNPSQPFGHLWYAVTGQTMDPSGLTQPEHQRLTRMQALRAKTTNCRFHLQNERIGSLRQGDYADLIVLSDDYFKAPADRIRYIESMLTLLDGEPVFAQGEFATLDDAFEMRARQFRGR